MLKKILISAALAAAASVPSYAQEAAPALTPAEKKVQSLYFAWQDCVMGKVSALTDQATAIAAARSKAGNAATTKAAQSTKLLSADDLPKLNEILEQSEAQFLTKLLIQATEPGETCKADMKLDGPKGEEMNASLQALAQKYGPAVLQRPAPQPQ